MKIKQMFLPFVLGLQLVLALALLEIVGVEGAAIVVASPLDAPHAPAATWHVCQAGPPVCDYATIQDAVDAANDNDVIKVAGGTYTGVQVREGITQVVYITKTLSILGGYSPADWDNQDPVANPTIVDAQGQGRVFYVDGGAGPDAISLSHLQITGGDATGLGGGEFDQYEGAGGGLYVISGNFVMENCAVYGNIASRTGWGAGGGIYLFNVIFFLSGNTIHHNTASSGTYSGIAGEGGGLAVSVSPGYVEDSLIYDNVASSSDDGIGGGIYVEGGAGTLAMYRNIVRGNVASVTQRGDGGGLYIGPDSHPYLENNVIMGNVCGVDASSSGAGILVELSSPILLHTTIHDNTGGDGSGLATYGFVANTTRMTNTIVSSQAIGIKVDTNQSVALGGVLFFANGDDTAGAGTITVNPPVVGGNPTFAPDGYHLLFGSPAVDAGLDCIALDDVDNQTRPFGPSRDLGADELVVVTTTVDPLVGATLIYTAAQGTTTTLEIPPGAVPQEITIVYMPIPSPTQPLLPDRFAVGHNFFLDAYQGVQLLPGFAFEMPVSLTVRYTETDILGVAESTLCLYYRDGSQWLDGNTTCTPPSSYSRDLAGNALRLPICHLSEWNMSGLLLGQKVMIYLPLILRHVPTD